MTNSDLSAATQKLKNDNSGDIIAYGGAAFVASLVEHNLIDEYHLFVNLSATGNGLFILNKLQKKSCFNIDKYAVF